MNRLYLRVALAVLFAAVVGILAALGIVRWLEPPFDTGGQFGAGIPYIASELEAADPSEWEGLLDRVRETSPMTWKVVASDESIAAYRKARFVGVPTETLWLHTPLRGGRYQLVFGPIEPVLPNSSVWVIGAFVLLLVGVSSLLVGVPLLRRVRTLRRGIDELGRGNFDIRIRDDAGDVFGEVARRLDEAAVQLRHLFMEREQIMQGVAHELGTPLARMRFRLAMLDTPDERERRDRLRAVERDIGELEGLARELVGWVESEQGPTDTVDVDLRGLVEEAVACCADEPAGASRHFYVCGGAGSVVRGNRRQLSRAIENVLRNAAKYARRSVQVSMFAHGEHVLMSVADDGPGIPTSERTRVLEPFVRLEASRSRKHGGIGLGLAIVKRTVEAHGGWLAIDEGPLGGARVTLVWPRCGLPSMRVSSWTSA